MKSRAFGPELLPGQEEPLRLDAAAVRVARSRGAIDLALGETLVRLFQGDRLLQLGYSKRVDYARERLGLAPRTMFLWVRLARELAERPVLRRAVVAGAVTPHKALTILPVAVGDTERAWTATAMTTSRAALERAVRSEGREPPGMYEAETVALRMNGAQQDRLDAAVLLARQTLGPGVPTWWCVEAICQEWLGAFGGWVPEEGRAAAADEHAGAPPPGLQEDAVARLLASLEEVAFALDGDDEGGGDLPDGAGARDLDARAQRLLAARRGFDEAFGVLAERIVREQTWAALGYRSLHEYCTERLGVAVRSLRERAWLERRLCALPELRMALKTGRLTYTKAVLVARDASPDDIAERIEDAASTTWQQTERESSEKQRRRDRAAGVRRVWGPQDATAVVKDAILSARALAAARGVSIDAGEALAVVADHFVAVWSEHLEHPYVVPGRRAVLTRHGGLCAVPGCSRGAEHSHHIRFRSQGGSDDPVNQVGVCAAHHLRGIHRGYLSVTGRGGELLFWKLGTGEVWETRGDDDVRRAAAEAQAEAAEAQAEAAEAQAEARREEVATGVG